MPTTTLANKSLLQVQEQALALPRIRLKPPLKQEVTHPTDHPALNRQRRRKRGRPNITRRQLPVLRTGQQLQKEQRPNEIREHPQQ